MGVAGTGRMIGVIIAIVVGIVVLLNVTPTIFDNVANLQANQYTGNFLLVELISDFIPTLWVVIPLVVAGAVGGTILGIMRLRG